MRNKQIVKITLAFLFPLFTITNVSAQQYLIKTNGEKVRFERCKIKKGVILLTISGQNEKLEIEAEDVEGYYSTEKNIMHFLKPLPNFYTVNSYDFEFVHRILEGRVKVYERTVSSYIANSGADGFGGTSSNTTTLYVEKGEEYFNVFDNSPLGESNKDKLEKLKDLVGDDPEIVKILNSKGYKHKYDNILEVVRKYNIKSHDDKINTTNANGKITLFRRKKSQDKKPVQLLVNGKEYTLSIKDKEEVELPANTDIKVCHANGPKDSCNLIRLSNHFEKYYEVSLNKDAKWSIEHKDKSYALFHLQNINYHIQRR